MSRSSKPLASNVPANDSSTMNTTRWPRSRRTLPIPTQLLVGPNAPSGKKTIVRASVTLASVSGDEVGSSGVADLEVRLCRSVTAMMPTR